MPEGLLYGAGFDFLQFSFKTDAGNMNVYKSIPYGDLGYSISIGKSLIINLKYKLFSSGSIYHIGTGVLF